MKTVIFLCFFYSVFLIGCASAQMSKSDELASGAFNNRNIASDDGSATLTNNYRVVFRANEVKIIEYRPSTWVSIRNAIHINEKDNANRRVFLENVPASCVDRILHLTSVSGSWTAPLIVVSVNYPMNGREMNTCEIDF